MPGFGVRCAQLIPVLVMGALVGPLPGPEASDAVVPPHADGPPPAHTGGFGEPTCLECHSDFGLNESGGRLTLDGPPTRYEPGRTYTISVVLESGEMVKAGFQLSARDPTGRQAGTFVATDPRAAVQSEGGVEYAHQTLTGSDADDPEVVRWRVAWTAPGGGVVHFHAAANSANGDDSPFGDLIYAVSATSEAPTSPGASQPSRWPDPRHLR